MNGKHTAGGSRFARLLAFARPGMTLRQRVQRLHLDLQAERSPVQRDWESGDPQRVAHVVALAAAIRAQIDSEVL